MIVENFISKYDNMIVVSYLPSQDKILNLGFIHEVVARISTGFNVGMWKPKCVHQWKTNITEQYQECKNCGIGHAL